MALSIMVVDDEPEVLATIKSMLEALGCEVMTLVDSGEAARRLEAERFNGIILDVVMPQLDGFELARRIRRSRLNRETPIVMMTGHDMEDIMRRGFSAGATCFLTKPVSQERLRTLIHAIRGPVAKDKRRYTRLPLRTTVTCKAGPHFDRAFVAGSSSISEGGMSLGPSGGVEAGQELEVEFSVPEALEPLKLRSRVVRREITDRIAVEFVELAAADREVIRRFIEESVKL